MVSYLLGHAGDCGSVVFEMTPHQMTGSQGRHEAELASQHSAGHHAGQLGSVLACREGELDQDQVIIIREREHLPGLTG